MVTITLLNSSTANDHPGVYYLPGYVDLSPAPSHAWCDGCGALTEVADLYRCRSCESRVCDDCLRPAADRCARCTEAGAISGAPTRCP